MRATCGSGSCCLGRAETLWPNLRQLHEDALTQVAAMNRDPLPRRAAPPFWLPVLAGLPLAACLLLLALPILGHGAATISRTLYLSAFVLWVLPLTALQRALWRRSTAGWVTVVVLLAATYAMALATRLLYQGMVAMRAEQPEGLDGVLLLRGLEGPWLALIAFCAIHAVVAYYTEWKQEQADRLHAQALARDSELRALRYQLQPHFLFNTLNAISGLVANDRGREARQMLACLGDFLRATLDRRCGHEVTLADEIALTESYLEIEKARLGERLQLRWHLSPGLLAARVPCLMLQPLVENAIRHGIAPRCMPGALDIRIANEDERLCVEVVNDLAEWDAGGPRNYGAAPARGDAVGLRNIAERLARLHPGASDLQAGVQDDCRYHVRIIMPLCIGTRWEA